MLSVMLSSASPAPVLDSREAGVVIATRHPATRSALWAVVDSASGVGPLGATGDLRDTMRLLHHLQPDAVFVDAAILGGPQLPDLATVRAVAPNTAVIVVGMGDHPAYAAHARLAGAFDYVRLDDMIERVPELVLAATAARQR